MEQRKIIPLGMKKGLHIIGDEIVFKKWSIGEIWYPCITKSFNINFDEIKIVAISPRLALDDEMLMITLIDKNKQFKQFSNFEFGKDPIKIFEKRLSLADIRNVEWEKVESQYLGSMGMPAIVG